MFDPRNELLNFIFDKDRSCFPAEEFSTIESLDMLVAIGLKTIIDKDTFLKCAWIVEGEQSIPKALKLFEYFNEHFAEFFDNNRGDFVRNLAEVCCVPAADGQSLGLCKFRDAGRLFVQNDNFIKDFQPFFSSNYIFVVKQLLRKIGT